MRETTLEDGARPPGLTPPESPGATAPRALARGELGPDRLFELFDELAESHRAAVLRVERANDAQELSFQDGTVRVVVSRQQERHRMAEILLHGGWITAQQMELALRQQREDDRPLGRILVESGFVSNEQVENAARFQAGEDLFALFTWNEGQYRLLEDSPDPQLPDRLAMLPVFEVRAVVDEARRRHVAWAGILQGLNSLDDIVVACQAVEASDGELSDVVLRSIDGMRTLRELPHATPGWSLFDCARQVKSLFERGLARLAEPAAVVDAARGRVEAGDCAGAIPIVRALLGRPGVVLLPDQLDQLASLSRSCGESRLAAELLLRAADLLAEDDPDAALELTQQARRADPGSIQAAQLLADLLLAQGAVDEWSAVVERLADLVADSGRSDEALALLEQLETQPHDAARLLRARVRILRGAGRRDDAVASLVELADVYGEHGLPDHVAAVYDEILNIDPSRDDIADALKRLLTDRPIRTTRLALIAVTVSVVTCVCIAMGTALSRSNSASELAADVRHHLGRGALDAAAAAIRDARDAGVEPEVVQQLELGLKAVREARSAERARQEAAKDRDRLAAADRIWEAGDLGAAFELYADLGPQGSTPRTADIAVRQRVDALLDDLEKRARVLELSIPDAPSATDPEPFRRAVLEDLDRVFDGDLQRLGQGAARIADHSAAEQLLELPRLERLRRAADAVVRSYEDASRVRQRYLAFELPEARAASELEAQLRFREAASAYGRLTEQHPWCEHFRDRAARCGRIADALEAIERATAAGEASAALEMLERLEQSAPGIEFERAVRLPLHVASRPPGATVMVNGEPLGRTPLQTTFSPVGEVVVRLAREGFRPEERVVDRTAAAGLELTLTRTPSFAVAVRGSVEFAPATDAHGRAYVVDREGRVTAVDLASGAVPWTFDTGDLSGLLPSPVVHGQNVIVASVDGTLRSLDRLTGELGWTRAGLPCDVDPALVGDVLVLATTDAGLIGLRAGSGRPLYRLALPATALRSLRWSRANVFAATTDGHVVAVRAADGRLSWRRRLRAGALVAPAAGSGVVLVATEDGRMTALDETDGRVRWQRPTPGSVRVPPVVAAPWVVVASRGELYTFALTDGEPGPVFRGPAAWTSELAVTADRLFVGDGDGRVAVIDRESFELRHWIRGRGGVRAPVVVAPGGELLVGFEDRRALGFRPLP